MTACAASVVWGNARNSDARNPQCTRLKSFPSRPTASGKAAKNTFPSADGNASKIFSAMRRTATGRPNRSKAGVGSLECVSMR